MMRVPKMFSLEYGFTVGTILEDIFLGRSQRIDDVSLRGKGRGAIFSTVHFWRTTKERATTIVNHHQHRCSLNHKSSSLTMLERGRPHFGTRRLRRRFNAFLHPRPRCIRTDDAGDLNAGELAAGPQSKLEHAFVKPEKCARSLVQARRDGATEVQS